MGYTIDPRKRWEFCRPDCTKASSEMQCKAVFSTPTSATQLCSWGSQCTMKCMDDDDILALGGKMRKFPEPECAKVNDKCTCANHGEAVKSVCPVTCNLECSWSSTTGDNSGRETASSASVGVSSCAGAITLV